jgi:TonB-linked SusC/RagA family outer membrane protein
MLIVVDGVEYPFSWDQIEMSDVESISVLKDAAGSIYGARAGNGVLLITTKRGKTGEAPTYDFSATYGFESPIRRAKAVDAATYATMTNAVGLSSWTADQIAKFKSGTDPAYPNTDWYSEVYNKSAPLVHYNLNSSGGTEKLNYFYSLGYFKNDGLLKSGDLNFNRFNFRSNIQAKLGRGFTGSLDIAGRQEKLSAPGARDYQQGDLNDVLYNVNQDVDFAQPIFAAHNPDPTKLAFGGHLGSAPIGRASSYWAGYTDDDSKYLDASLNLKYDAPFLNGLSASARVSTNNEFSYIKQFSKEFYCYPYDVTTGLYGTPQLCQPTTSDRETMSRYSQMTTQVQVNYDKKVGAHSISAMILGEYIDNASNNLMGYRKNYISTTVQQLFAGGDLDKDATGSADQDGRIGYAGRVNYAYAGKYLAELTVRYDGSSRYAPSKRWGTFPSLSLGWRLSEEQFIKNISAINNLKLRASIGKAGDDADVPAYAYLTGYNYNSTVWGGGQVFGNTIYQGINSTGIANPNLVWRTSTNYNLGLDGGFWKNLLSFEFDVFYRKVEHVAGTRALSIPSTFGAGLPQEPINSFDNRGFELVLKHENNIGDLKYSVSGMLTYARGKWIHFDEPIYPDAETRARLGNSGQWMNRIMGYTAMGLFQSQAEIDKWADQDLQGNATIKPGDIKYLDYNHDGKIDAKDVHVIGKGTTPDMMFSFNLTLQYKGFDLDALFQGASDFNAYYHQNVFENGTVPFTFMADYWTPTNTGAKYPRLVDGEAENNKAISSFWLMDATYLRLKNLTIGYTIPKSLCSKMLIKSCRIYITGLDILTFDKVSPLDPESGASLMANGVAPYPKMKNIQGGIDLRF